MITALPVVDAPGDATALRELFAAFPTGVAAIVARVDGAPEALVVSSFQVGISLEPPMVSFAVQNSSTTWPVLRRAERLGVSVLSAGHGGLVRQLASKDKAGRLAGVDSLTLPSGAILLERASAWLECALTYDYAAGDHRIIVLTVTGTALHDRAPLVFHGSRFHGLTPLVPLGSADGEGAR